jgi:hypothetical protein
MYGQMEAMYEQMVPLLKAAGNAQWARAVVKDATPSGLQALTIPKTFYSDFASLFARGSIRRAPVVGDGLQTVPETRGRSDSGRLPAPRTEPRDGRIRVGCHCSFMDSDTIRFIMSAVIKRHDRKRFTVFGYSSTGLRGYRNGVRHHPSRARTIGRALRKRSGPTGSASSWRCRASRRPIGSAMALRVPRSGLMLNHLGTAPS